MQERARAFNGKAGKKRASERKNSPAGPKKMRCCASAKITELSGPSDDHLS